MPRINKNSCGAIFYTFNLNNVIGVVLGDEGEDKEEWLPFKGCAEDDETLEDAAKREILEESGGLVMVDNINLEHRFSTKRKNYYIGLVKVPYDIVDIYNNRITNETRYAFKEKKKLKFFPLNEVLSNENIHNLTKSSIIYFWDRLNSLNLSNQHITTSQNLRRNHAITIEQAISIKNKYTQFSEPVDDNISSMLDIINANEQDMQKNQITTLHASTRTQTPTPSLTAPTSSLTAPTPSLTVPDVLSVPLSSTSSSASSSASSSPDASPKKIVKSVSNMQRKYDSAYVYYPKKYNMCYTPNMEKELNKSS